jgi:tetratricopeptide (TPR) repeat protein
MSKFDEVSSLRALTFFVVLVVTSATLPSQESPQVKKPPIPAAQRESFTATSPQPSSAAPAPEEPPPASADTGAPGATTSVTSAPGAASNVQINATPEELGDSLAVHQRYQAAIEAYLKVTEHSAALSNKMGIAYQMLFDLKDATRCYEDSLKLDPHNPRVLNNLATVYDSQKMYGKAERYYKKALKYDPHSALILRNLGSNFMSQHKYKKGADLYRAAIAIDPHILEQHTTASVQNPTPVKDRGALHYYMAKGCMSAGNHDCAIHNLRLAMNEGYTNAKKVAADSVFAGLHNTAAYQELIASQTQQ